MERILYTTAFLLNQFAFVGIWLGFKVTSRWEASRAEEGLKNKLLSSKKTVIRNRLIKQYTDYNGFTIYNAFSIIYAVVGWKLIRYLQINDYLKAVLLGILVIVGSVVLSSYYNSVHPRQYP